MPLPEITHLQFAVLASLIDQDLAGGVLREQLAANGMNHTRAAFYQLMARLEDARFVSGRYEQRVVDDVTITERIYHLTATGMRVTREAQAFYLAAFAVA